MLWSRLRPIIGTAELGGLPACCRSRSLRGFARRFAGRPSLPRTRVVSLPRTRIVRGCDKLRTLCSLRRITCRSTIGRGHSHGGSRRDHSRGSSHIPKGDRGNQSRIELDKTLEHPKRGYVNRGHFRYLVFAQCTRRIKRVLSVDDTGTAQDRKRAATATTTESERHRKARPH